MVGKRKPGGVSRRALLSSGLLGLCSCAWTLHPERRGTTPHGRIDTVPLIIDILWFLPGLVPGVVCLAVDFASGAIYTSGGAKVSIRRKGTVVVHRPPLEAPMLAHAAIVDAQGQVLRETEREWSKTHTRRADQLRFELATLDAAGPLVLELRLGDDQTRSFELAPVDGEAS